MKRALAVLSVFLFVATMFTPAAEANCVIRDSKNKKIERTDCFYGVMLDIPGNDAVLYVGFNRNGFPESVGWPEFYEGPGCQVGQTYTISYARSGYLVEQTHKVDHEFFYFASQTGASIPSNNLSFFGSDGVCYQVDPFYFSGLTLAPIVKKRISDYKFTPPFHLE